MIVPLDAAMRRVRDELEDNAKLLHGVAGGRVRGFEPKWRRAEFRYVNLSKGLFLQFTTYDSSRAHVRNAPASSQAAKELIDEALAVGFRNWHIETQDGTLEVRITKKLKSSVTFRESSTEVDLRAVREHDRQKSRLLPPSHPALQAIGFTDSQGKIRASKQSKYRQVDEFLRLMWGALKNQAAAIDKIESGRQLDMVDLGCGNAYLTFAALAYLRDIQGIDVRITGVDIRDEVRKRNNSIAHALGLGNCIEFVSSSIADFDPTMHPDAVLSLHACDTATDEALARAVNWKSAVVLAAPCCHHDIQRQLRRNAFLDGWKSSLLKDGILAERLGDVLTDAARASLMRMNGYSVDVMQFVDPENTARNVMIRATLDAGEQNRRRTDQSSDYKALIDEWRIAPALDRMLHASHSGVGDG